MNFAKGILAIVGIVSGTTLGVNALAQDDVTAKKVAPIQNLVPNAYGKIELRHKTKYVMEGSDDDLTNTVPSLQVRPTLGSTFFDGKVDSYFTWLFSKHAGDNTLKRDGMGLYNYTNWSLASGVWGAFSPFAYTEFDAGEGASFSRSWIGGEYSTPKADLASGIGTFSPSFAMELAGVLESNQSRSKIDVDGRTEALQREDTPEGAALREASDDEKEEANQIDQRHNTIAHNIYPSIKYTHAALGGFSTRLGAEIYRTYEPKYENEVVGDDNRSKHVGYAVSEATVSKLALGYKFANGLSLTNEIRHTTNGIWEARSDDGGTRFENRIKLSSPLF